MRVKITIILVLFLSFSLFVQKGSFGESYQDTIISKELDWWENMRGTLGLQVGNIVKGDVIYHISFDNPPAFGGHGESELEWPLSKTFIGLFGSVIHYAELTIDEKVDKARFEVSWYTNITKELGKRMEDSDWIENDVGYINTYYPGYPVGNNPGKDFFGELDTYLDSADILEISCLYNFFVRRTIRIGLLGGWRFHKFEFYGTNLEQKGYGPYEKIVSDWRARVSNETIASRWLEYQAKQQMPYIGIATEFSLTEKVKLGLKFGYSDWVRIRDTDTHLYPDYDADNPGWNLNMMSTSRCKGEGYLGEVMGTWRPWTDWTLGIGVNYINVDTSGPLKQSMYLNGFLLSESDGIDDKVTSESWLVDIVIKHIF